MSKKVFVSYSSRQGEWVWNRLVPCLRAGGADVLIDRERFEVGKATIGQMDEIQGSANLSILVLSPDYLKSRYCVHEMNRAINHDSKSQNGTVILVKRVACRLPQKLTALNLLEVDFRNDKDARPWDLLLQACEADLGADAPHWLSVRDDIFRFLKRNQSVNLVVSGHPQWRELINHLHDDFLKDLGIVDLENDATVPRRGLVTEILKAFGFYVGVPEEPEDLVAMDRILSAPPVSRLALLHFDLVADRPHYGIDLFAALRYLLMESRKLVLLVQSYRPFSELLPQGHPLSVIDIKPVELKGRK